MTNITDNKKTRFNTLTMGREGVGYETNKPGPVATYYLRAYIISNV